MLAEFLSGEMTLPSLPTSVALAAVATLGYLVGRMSRDRQARAAQARRDLQQSLDDARQLEQITDDMLEATRRALEECRRISASARTDAPPAASATRRARGPNGKSALGSK